MAPEILLLGANGQVGWELRRALSPVGRVTPLTRAELDITDLDSLVRTVRQAKPAVVVNAAAYTAVDKAESDQKNAFGVNAEVPAAIAQELKQYGGLLVDYSTDFVFDGDLDRPYNERDVANPLSTYGRTKLDGLRVVVESGCRHLVFRVSWVYSARGTNFVKTILRLAREKTELSVVADQVGAPTSADFIADVTAQALMALANGRGEEGVYHLAPAGATSWHNFAQTIVSEAKAAGESLALSEGDIKPITTEEYPTAARRPANSVLETGKLKAAFGLHMPMWNEPLPRIIRELLGK